MQKIVRGIWCLEFGAWNLEFEISFYFSALPLPKGSRKNDWNAKNSTWNLVHVI